MRGRLQGTKRADGRFQIVVLLTSPTGAKHRKTLISRKNETLRDLQNRALKLISQNPDRIHKPEFKPTVRYLLTMWRFAYRHQWSKNTKRSNELASRLYLIPALGHVKIEQLTPAQIETALLKLVERGTRVPSLAKEVLRAALSYAMRKEWITRNVAEIAKAPKIKRPAPPPPITTANLEKIIEHAESQTSKALYRFLAEVGIRPSEAFAVKWNHLYTDESGAWLKIPNSKTAAGEMERPISPSLYQELLLLKSNSVFVFSTPSGTRIDYSKFNKEWHRTLERAGVPSTKPYELRHLCATQLIERFPGQDHLIAALMGHKSISTTRQYYARAQRAKLRKIVDGT